MTHVEVRRQTCLVFALVFGRPAADGRVWVTPLRLLDRCAQRHPLRGREHALRPPEQFELEPLRA